MKNIATLTLFTLFISCENDRPESYLTKEFLERNEFEVSTMYNNTHLKEFLEFVAGQDKKYRPLETSVLEKYGADSKEYKDFMFLIKKTDAENLVRVESVLLKFGYPNIHEIGVKAASTPFKVIQHSEDFDTQAKYFGMFYQSFKDFHIKDFLFEVYMDNMYVLKFGEPFEITPPYQWQHKIDTMIIIMNLKILSEGGHEH